MKNIRRCLNPPNPNYASFCAAIGSALATLLAASDLFTKGAPFWEIAALIGVAAAAATAAGLQLRADRRAGDNPHLREAQADADILVTWQEDARVQVDRDLQARLIDEQRRMRVEEDAPSLTDDSGDRSVVCLATVDQEHIGGGRKGAGM